MSHPLFTLLAEAAPAAAPAAGGGTPTTGAPADPPAAGGSEGTGNSIVSLLVPIGLMFAVFYLLMIRPQQKKEKELRDMVSKMKKNDKVVLQGGIFAVVMQVRDKDVIVKIDEKNDVRIRVLKSAVLGIEGKPGAPDTKQESAPPQVEDEESEEKSGAGK